MVQVPSTARALRELKNTSGLKSEIEHSKSFHSEGYPLLVSPQLLRSKNLGQIDLGRIKKDRGEWLIELGEVKSSSAGLQMMGIKQRFRLYDSLRFITSLFGHRGRLVKCVNQNDLSNSP
jgi:hypothetical protein